ncbi:pyrroloquinoline quinone biosynthesis protein PqqB [soil metagenome]
MQVTLLGTAAGGGFPQWNCWCPTCRIARGDPERARHRSQSSAAVSADGRRWFLLNASPDVQAQLARLPSGEPAGMRHVPIEGVVLTDGELDHTLGVLLLREGRLLQIYATAAVRSIVEQDSRIVPVTRAFAEVRLEDLPIGAATPLTYRDGCPSGLTVTCFPVPAGPPRFAAGEHAGHTVGLLVHDAATGGVCAFVPGCGGLDEALLARLAEAELVLFDGTFWTDEELITLGIGDRTAREMDHLPVSGPGGSLERMASLRSAHRVYTHINNTNPMLVEDSPERLLVERLGVVVGADGMRFTL